jgi:type II secretory ATPase GspE/PulE/Tfp pilus assembly ATPase PilB-like protein
MRVQNRTSCLLIKVLDTLKEEGVIKSNATWNSVPFYHPVEKNGNDGYKGRAGIHEVLQVTPTIKELVMGDATADKIEEQARKEGMLTMLEDGIYKAARGLTSIEEVLRVINE